MTGPRTGGTNGKSGTGFGGFDGDNGFDDVMAVARKLEEAVEKVSGLFLQVMQIRPEDAVSRFFEIQSQILRLDRHAREQLRESLEDKNVVELSRGNVFVACALTSGLAIGLLNRLPRRASTGVITRSQNILREKFVGKAGWTALAFASFYALVGKGAVSRMLSLCQKSPVNPGPR